MAAQLGAVLAQPIAWSGFTIVRFSVPSKFSVTGKLLVAFGAMVIMLATVLVLLPLAFVTVNVTS